MAQVEKLRDEGVQLKILQTALTLMQSPVLAEDEVGLQPVSACICWYWQHLCEPRRIQ